MERNYLLEVLRTKPSRFPAERKAIYLRQLEPVLKDYLTGMGIRGKELNTELERIREHEFTHSDAHGRNKGRFTINLIDEELKVIYTPISGTKPKIMARMARAPGKNMSEDDRLTEKMYRRRKKSRDGNDK
jgi:hypothetical protein